VQQKTAKALARGELGFDATCDLHGMTAALARHQLERVVEASVRVGRRTLLVIVGRGLHSGPEGPVLPALVVRTLRSRPVNEHVLAFAHADPAHGGQGALAVLLRRSGGGK
jgi:DNA-nicking Smr family endonuclease